MAKPPRVDVAATMAALSRRRARSTGPGPAGAATRVLDARAAWGPRRCFPSGPRGCLPSAWVGRRHTVAVARGVILPVKSVFLQKFPGHPSESPSAPINRRSITGTIPIPPVVFCMANTVTVLDGIGLSRLRSMPRLPYPRRTGGSTSCRCGCLRGRVPAGGRCRPIRPGRGRAPEARSALPPLPRRAAASAAALGRRETGRYRRAYTTGAPRAAPG